jgi:hypothetical protein
MLFHKKIVKFNKLILASFFFFKAFSLSKKSIFNKQDGDLCTNNTRLSFQIDLISSKKDGDLYTSNTKLSFQIDLVLSQQIMYQTKWQWTTTLVTNLCWPD